MNNNDVLNKIEMLNNKQKNKLYKMFLQYEDSNEAKQKLNDLIDIISSIKTGAISNEHKDLKQSDTTLNDFNFPSRYNIGHTIMFIPMCKDLDKYKIESDYMMGEIVAVRFTKAKIFYDCLSDYYGIVFRDIDSCKVKTYKELNVDNDNKFSDNEVIGYFKHILLDDNQ